MKKLVKVPLASKTLEREFQELTEYMVDLMSSIYKHQVLEGMNKNTVNKFTDDKQVGNYAVVFNKLAKQVNRKLLKRFSNKRIEEISKKLLQKTDRQSQGKLYKEIEKQIGLSSTQLKLKEKTRAFQNPLLLETAQWMKKLRDETLEMYTANSLRIMTQGGGIDSVLKEFDGMVSKRKNHAKFTARNQINNFNSLMTKSRALELGVQKGVWVTAEDERVRPSHEARNGKEFDLKEGLYSSLDGQTLLPGVDYQCRCTFFLVFEDELENK